MTNDRLLKSANDAFSDENWAKAADLYDQLYQAEKTVKLNHLLVKSRYEMGRPETALAVMREQEQSYFEDNYHVILWTKVMLANRLNVMVRVAMKTLTAVPHEMGVLVTEYEDVYLQTAHFSKDYQQFYQLSAQNLTGQRHQFEVGKALPLKEWLAAATHLLTDPFVKPIVRVSLLELMHKLKTDTPVHYLWLDGQPHDVVPSDLPELDDIPIVQATQAALGQVVADDDPITQQLYSESLRVQLSLLYPFVDHAVTNSKKWVRVLTGQISPDDPNSELQTMMKWQAKLAKMMQEMTP
ncbi:hypothetical protein [Secundilactobacillus collinoides]|uniref:TPR repeat-containing protein n=2 Tax=Secundilactobacillus collinoides TaxID=33960 RepID=A0A0R2B3V9_SECCO|nr:hypothetical protein [Secundilactobacillus collinoides]KRM74072.1 hypothetical protein FC82_GL000850 [Secundilactobacillus collinoides DSM 20515 = JCM 1123]